MIRSCAEILEGEDESNCGVEFEGKYTSIQPITQKIIYKLSVYSKCNPPTAGNTFCENFRSSVMIHGRVFIYCRGKEQWTLKFECFNTRY